MVIDAKLPPEDPPQLSVPPPAYAPLSESPTEPPHNAPHAYQQYPPSSQPHSGSSTLLPQWHTPAPGTQSMSADEWAGQQYRNQRESIHSCSLLPSHHPFAVGFAHCARGDHDATTSFGLCGIICAILLFPLGLIFLWYAII